MPDVTTKMGLVKPLTTEEYDIAVQNGNMDSIEAYVVGLEDGTNTVVRLAFDPTQTPVLVEGQMGWNFADQALQVMSSHGSTLQIGQELYVSVINQTGVTIPNGTLVMQDGVYNGTGRIKVKPAILDGTYPTLSTLGVTTHEMLQGETGHVTTFGKVNELDLTGNDVGETWIAGDVLYGHPTMPGKFTKVQPIAPQNKLVVGGVLIAGLGGILFVRLSHGSRLSETDRDVKITNPQNNELLAYNTAEGVWKNIANTIESRLLINGGTLESYSEKKNTNAGATGTVTLDLANEVIFDLTLTGATTLAFSNVPNSGKAVSVTLLIRQGATPYAVTFPAGVKWSNDVVPTTIATASKTAIITMVTVDGGTRWYAFLAGDKFTT